MKTIKRAGLAMGIIAAVAVLVLVVFLVKFLVRDPEKKGFEGWSVQKAAVRGEGELFGFKPDDIAEVEVTVREVDYDAEEEEDELIFWQSHLPAGCFGVAARILLWQQTHTDSTYIWIQSQLF